MSKNINITILQDGRIMFDQEEIPFPLLQKRIRKDMILQYLSLYTCKSQNKR